MPTPPDATRSTRVRPAPRRRPTRTARARQRVAAAVARRRRPRTSVRAYRSSAQQQLRRFRQGSALAVALAALLLMISGARVAVEEQPESEAQNATTAAAAPAADSRDPLASVDEATGTIRELALSFYDFLPRLLVVVLLIALAVIVERVVKAFLERRLAGWERIAAITAVSRLIIFLVAAVATVSILAGDVRAVVGSLGLLGLAASWALQTPIESFTGWLLNSFRGYYRVGDRIMVGDVFGDVYRIDMLTTTVWEAGGAGKAVTAAQSTGALITVPNWEVLRSNIVNYSRDFPYVWDEITVAVANESDLEYSREVLSGVARHVLGEQMERAAQQYDQLLKAARLAFEVEEVPYVYLSMAESWTDCTIRYLVPVRSRRRWGTALTLAVSRELKQPAHQGRIIGVYPRREIVTREQWPNS